MSTTEGRIAVRLYAALNHHGNAEITAPVAAHGLAVAGPENPRILLTVEDIARIAAAAVADETAATTPLHVSA
jgi:hypothetical protein